MEEESRIIRGDLFPVVVDITLMCIQAREHRRRRQQQ